MTDRPAGTPSMEEMIETDPFYALGRASWPRFVDALDRRGIDREVVESARLRILRWNGFKKPDLAKVAAGIDVGPAPAQSDDYGSMVEFEEAMAELERRHRMLFVREVDGEDVEIVAPAARAKRRAAIIADQRDTLDHLFQQSRGLVPRYGFTYWRLLARCFAIFHHDFIVHRAMTEVPDLMPSPPAPSAP